MMDETIMNTVEEQTAVHENETNNDDALKGAIEEQLKKIQHQNMLIGAQTICRVVLNKISAAMSKPGKRTMNDYKRIIKDIEKFCATGLSRKVNEDGETEPTEEDSVNAETVQN